MENNIIPITENEEFIFACSNEVRCFNECCKDLNQFLTPYDVVRLKNNLGMKSNHFLQKYTFQQIGPETGLPIISLKSDPATELKCPFVTQSGCSVYEDRPSSCRTYPLIKILSRSRETGKATEKYMLLKEPHCNGFDDGQKWTIQRWIDSQGLSIYYKINDLLIEIISLKNRLIPGQLDLASKHLFHMVCYDLDTFRKNIIQNELPDGFKTNKDIKEAAEKDDIHLLKVGLEWLKQVIFGGNDS